jgi:hypothetical protein
VNFNIFLWLINYAFVGQKNFDIIEMYGAITKKVKENVSINMKGITLEQK